jgi:hypothetical protein
MGSWKRAKLLAFRARIDDEFRPGIETIFVGRAAFGGTIAAYVSIALVSRYLTLNPRRPITLNCAAIRQNVGLAYRIHRNFTHLQREFDGTTFAQASPCGPKNYE